MTRSRKARAAEVKSWELLLTPVASDDQLLRALLYAVGAMTEDVILPVHLRQPMDHAWLALEQVQLMMEQKL